MPHAGAGQGKAKKLFPSKPGWPDTTLVISHSKRMAVNAAANRALAPQTSKLLQLETQVHIDCCQTTTPQNDKFITPQNSPQSIWPGLRLIGPGAASSGTQPATAPRGVLASRPCACGGPARVADGQAVGRALRGAPPYAGAPVLPVRLGRLQ